MRFNRARSRVSLPVIPHRRRTTARFPPTGSGSLSSRAATSTSGRWKCRRPPRRRTTRADVRPAPLSAPQDDPFDPEGVPRHRLLPALAVAESAHLRNDRVVIEGVAVDRRDHDPEDLLLVELEFLARPVDVREGVVVGRL